MSIKNAGRRGLFGLLAAAPLAVAGAATAKPRERETKIDIHVDEVERKIAVRLMAGRWPSSIGENGPEAILPLRSSNRTRLGEAIERTYGLSRIGR